MSSRTPGLHLSHDAALRRLLAIEFGRVGEDQPATCWVPVTPTCAHLLDGPGGRVVGFCVDRLDELDPDAPEQAAIWEAPCFDAPALGLTGVVAGEVAVAARAWFGGEDSFDRRLARIATAARGPEALHRWRACLEAGDATAHFALGYTLLDLGRAREAHAHLRRYTEIAPMGAWNWCWYGQAAEAIGEAREARRAYRRAIALGDGPSAGAGRDAARRLTGLADAGSWDDRRAP
jgi:tetratricopeptide (TPR) repeat protein